METIEEKAIDSYRKKSLEFYNLKHSANGEMFNNKLTVEDGYNSLKITSSGVSIPFV